MRKPVFLGAGVAIITPFKGEEVDFDKLGELIEFQIKGGIDCIVICGTTGEASAMPDAEHIATVRFAVEKTKNRVPVVAGAGSNDTKHAVELSKSLEALGVDALLSVTPYYNKTTQRGLIAHFSAVSSAVKLPVILYNVPARTNLNIAPETLGELSKIENIVGVKECNLDQVPAVINACEKDFYVYSGEDANILPLMSWGGKGVISVMANIIPRDTHDICAKFLEEDLEGARRISLKTINLVKALFCEVSPIPTKEAMNQLGMDVGQCRLPLVEISPAGRETVRKALVEYGLL
jgi:4-hydroxy-tetrahydrodipicolinate synthase